VDRHDPHLAREERCLLVELLLGRSDPRVGERGRDPRRQLGRDTLVQRVAAVRPLDTHHESAAAQAHAAALADLDRRRGPERLLEGPLTASELDDRQAVLVQQKTRGWATAG
jgi:hypothetical protein